LAKPKQDRRPVNSIARFAGLGLVAAASFMEAFFGGHHADFVDRLRLVAGEGLVALGHWGRRQRNYPRRKNSAESMVSAAPSTKSHFRTPENLPDLHKRMSRH